jgi:hypothetical protein
MSTNIQHRSDRNTAYRYRQERLPPHRPQPRAAIVVRQKATCGHLSSLLTNLRFAIGLKAGVGAHHLGRLLKKSGHHVRLIPATYVRPYAQGQKNESPFPRVDGVPGSNTGNGEGLAICTCRRLDEAVRIPKDC